MKGTFMLRRQMIGLLILALLVLAGCSDPNDNNASANAVHPLDWLVSHGDDPGAQGTADDCRGCHGPDYSGSAGIPGCTECHLSGPPFTAHPASWGDTYTGHQTFAQDLSWVTCATSICHGTTLHGGDRGPSCFSADRNGLACHVSGPPKPHALYDDPSLHGVAAKGTFDPSQNMVYCRNCHGRPTNIFDGGMVSDPAILNLTGGQCSSASCHPAATAHPTNWQGTNDVADPFNWSSTHRTITHAVIDTACALCHNTVSTGAGPKAGAPSCFSSTFTNSDGSTTGCHASGPGSAPHVVPFTDPNLHGPAAKADLTYCQSCHGEPGGAGSNPRFNIAVGNLTNGCEDCHVAGAAHPPAPVVIPSADRWTFRGDPTSTRRTHFGSGNPLTACALCHGADLSGGSGPSCTTGSCHVNTTNFALNCTACHATPPDGGADQTAATPVNHTTVSNQTGFNDAHDQCTTCHGAKDDGTGKLSTVGVDYQLFDRNVAALNQGGDHLDGFIEMNGPSPATGAGYNETTFGCDNACHGGDVPYRLTDSALTVEYGSYGNDPGPGCTFCHGYPPDGSADLTGSPTPVNHTGVSDLAAFLAAHNDCAVCHGVKDDGTGTHLPIGNYNVATDHNDGNINLNLDTQYNQATFSCDLACHSNAAPFQLSDSQLPVVLDSYGSGGGAGACDACHETGVAGAPQVTASGPHTGIWTCEDCHTGHGAGTVIIPNNTLVGINYTAAGHGNGISLGGAATSGTTEAEICWNCHDVLGSSSEWGQNTEINTGNSNYDYGQIYTDAATTTPTSNWVNAWWKSGTSQFAYKTGRIQSTHSANASGTSGVDTVDLIRCSYCHDVHDLNQVAGDSVSGPPYLRGTWMGNPYQEDGAPQSGTSYSNLQRFGAVPRGNIAQAVMGGYWIDQNSSWPTTGGVAGGAVATAWQLSNSAGLCTLCHGSDVNNLNQFGSASAAWVGSNGHANAVIGGTGTSSGLAFNVFDARGGTATTSTNPSMAFQGASAPGDRGFYGFRNTGGDAAGWTPRVNPTGETRNYNYYEWGATVTNQTLVDNQYHKFPCSKCHNPHASRLPRLMITNCLDTKHNTWDDSYQLASSPQGGSNNINRSISNWTSAQNCHRVAGVTDGSGITVSGTGPEPVDTGAVPGVGAGWNLVTPWTGTGLGVQDNGVIP